MNRTINLFYFLALLFTASINANAQGQYATEVDIKAAYCLGATQPYAESTDKADPRLTEFINLNNANFLRLKNFSTARAKSMNSDAINEMTVALTAGRDARQRSKLINDECFKEVYPNKDLAIDAITTKKLQECTARKQGESEGRRLAQCFDLNFLPY